jgi:CRISPR system Cascade subunit CasB
MSEHSNPSSHSQRFVAYTVERCQQDKGMAAALKRADNPATEYQCWEHLAAFQIDLEKSYERLPHAAIAAAIAKAKAEQNGSLGIGAAIARCYEDGNASDQAKAKLRRLLACDSTAEACRILRGLFSLIDSKSGQALDYARLLAELLRFHGHAEAVKARWAQDFYRRAAGADTEDAA